MENYNLKNLPFKGFMYVSSWPNSNWKNGASAIPMNALPLEIVADNGGYIKMLKSPSTNKTFIGSECVTCYVQQNGKKTRVVVEAAEFFKQLLQYVQELGYESISSAILDNFTQPLKKDGDAMKTKKEPEQEFLLIYEDDEYDTCTEFFKSENEAMAFLNNKDNYINREANDDFQLIEVKSRKKVKMKFALED